MRNKLIGHRRSPEANISNVPRAMIQNFDLAGSIDSRNIFVSSVTRKEESELSLSRCKIHSG